MNYIGIIGKAIEPAIVSLGYDWKIGIGLLSSFAAREVFVGTITTIYSIGSDNEQNIVERLKNEKTEDGKTRFGLATGVSLLIFYVFAMQCMSTLAIVKKETGKWSLAIGQFILLLAVAYGASFACNLVLS